MHPDVIIIGAGAAGLMAAGTAGELGAVGAAGCTGGHEQNLLSAKL